MNIAVRRRGLVAILALAVVVAGLGAAPAAHAAPSVSSSPATPSTATASTAPASATASSAATASATASGTAASASTGPANDRPDAAAALTGALPITASGTTVGATADPGLDGDDSVWWAWTAPRALDVKLLTDGSAFDTVLDVYRDSDSDGTPDAYVASNDDRDASSTASQVTFHADAGTRYYVDVWGKDGATGGVSLRLAQDGADPSFLSGSRTLSPNGDQQSDTLDQAYDLRIPANVSARITTPDGADAATLLTDVSRPAGWSWLHWDGQLDDGSIAPDGRYELVLTATSVTGEDETITREIAVDTRLPGHLTSPTPGQTISGTATWSFTPTAGFDGIQEVWVGGDLTGPAAQSAGADGTWSGTIDASDRTEGSKSIYVFVQYVDAFGDYQSWSSPSTTVVVSEPAAPFLQTNGTTDVVFSPNGDGLDDTVGTSYVISDTGGGDLTETVRVVDSAGETVKTLVDGLVPADPPQPGWYEWRSITWDGTDDSGAPVPDGRYRVLLDATDATGLTMAQGGWHWDVDRRQIGALTAPVAGDTVPGTSYEWSFRPTDGVGDVQSAAFVLNGHGHDTVYAARQDGTWGDVVDTSGDGDGTVDATAYVSWTDRYGASHSGYLPSVRVTLAHPMAPTVQLSGQSEAFAPGPDGRGEYASTYYWITDNGVGDQTVTARVVDASGATVHSFEDAVTRAPDSYQWDHYASWDGTDTAGNQVPDGIYTFVVDTVDNTGLTGHAELTWEVDRQVPGTLAIASTGPAGSGLAAQVTPSVGSSLDWTFTPSQGFTTISSVSVVVAGSAAPEVDAAGDDGIFAGSVDVSAYDTTEPVYAVVNWTDAYGVGHSWSTPDVSVAISNPAPPQIRFLSDEGTFSPDGDGNDDSFSLTYQIADSDPGQLHVQARIVAADGTLVRLITDADETPDGSPTDYCWTSTWWYCHWSTYTWDGLDDAGNPVPDGDYQVTLDATDSEGLTATQATRRVTVDRRGPGELVSPVAGATLAGTTRIVFRPTEGLTIEEVDVHVAGADVPIYGASANGTWRSSLAVGGLPQGAATLTYSVSYLDAYGVGHWWNSPESEVAIDPTGIPLDVTADVPTTAAPVAASFTIATSDPNSANLTARVDFGDGTPVQTLAVARRDDGSYADLAVEHTYASAGSYVAFVSVSNGSGGYASKSIPIQINGAPNTPPRFDASLSATAGAAPLVDRLALHAADPDGDPTTYDIDWGDGSDHDTGAAGSDTQVPHVFAQPGRYLVRAEVRDGRVGTVRWLTVDVVLPSPLTAHAGDDQRIPVGAVTLDGSGSTPSGLIARYDWAIDGQAVGSGARITTSISSAGTHTATLTVHAGGETATDTLTIDAFAPPPADEGLRVAVTSTDGGAAIAGAEVTVIEADGTRLTAQSGGDGIARVTGLPDGPVTAYAWADGYRPGTGPANVVAGAGTASIALEPGAVGAITVSSHPMTIEEITSAGIDVNDPANSHVYEAEIELCASSDSCGEAESPSTIRMGSGGWVDCVSGCGGWQDDSYVADGYAWRPQAVMVEGQPVVQWLVIPLEAKFLKEFFDVQMVVQNLTTGFTFTGGTAALNLPEGLTLAPTARGQSLQQRVDDIPGGASKSLSWVVRGDTEGEYDVSVDYVASVDPIQHPLHLVGQNAPDQKIKVWGASALTTVIKVDSTAKRWMPYGVDIEVTNVSPVPVYNFSIQLKEPKPGAAQDYFFTPGTQVHSTAAIDPGKTFTAHWVVFPDLGDGQAVGNGLADSLIEQTGGDVDLRPTLAHRDPDDPLLSEDSFPVFTTTVDGSTMVSWANPTLSELAGVRSYEVWSRDALSSSDDWTLVNGNVAVGAAGNSLTIAKDDPRAGTYYIVGAHLPGGVTLWRSQLSTELPAETDDGDGPPDEASPACKAAGGTNKTQFLGRDVQATCLVRRGSGWLATGTTYVNGLVIAPKSSSLTLNSDGTITGQGDVGFTVNLPFLSAHRVLVPGILSAVRIDRDFEFSEDNLHCLVVALSGVDPKATNGVCATTMKLPIDLPASATAKLSWDHADGLDLEFDASLDIDGLGKGAATTSATASSVSMKKEDNKVSTITGKVALSADNKNGLRVGEITIGLDGEYHLGKVFTVKKIELSWLPKDHKISGAVDISWQKGPSGTPPWDFSGKLTWDYQHKSAVELAVDVDNLNISLFDDILMLQSLGATVSTFPNESQRDADGHMPSSAVDLKVDGRAGFSLFPEFKVAGAKVVLLTANASTHWDLDKLSFAFDGEAKLFDKFTLGQMDASVSAVDQTAHIGGTLGFQSSLVSVTASETADAAHNCGDPAKRNLGDLLSCKPVAGQPDWMMLLTAEGKVAVSHAPDTGAKIAFGEKGILAMCTEGAYGSHGGDIKLSDIEGSIMDIIRHPFRGCSYADIDDTVSGLQPKINGRAVNPFVDTAGGQGVLSVLAGQTYGVSVPSTSKAVKLTLPDGTVVTVPTAAGTVTGTPAGVTAERLDSGETNIRVQAAVDGTIAVRNGAGAAIPGVEFSRFVGDPARISATASAVDGGRVQLDYALSGVAPGNHIELWERGATTSSSQYLGTVDQASGTFSFLPGLGTGTRTIQAVVTDADGTPRGTVDLATYVADMHLEGVSGLSVRSDGTLTWKAPQMGPISGYSVTVTVPGVERTVSTTSPSLKLLDIAPGTAGTASVEVVYADGRVSEPVALPFTAGASASVAGDPGVSVQLNPPAPPNDPSTGPGTTPDPGPSPDPGATDPGGATHDPGTTPDPGTAGPVTTGPGTAGQAGTTKAATQTWLKGAKKLKRLKRGKKATVKVAVAGGPTATGTATLTLVHHGRRITLKAQVVRGVATFTVRYKRLKKKGIWKVVAAYGGDATHQASVSAPLKVRLR